VGVPGPLVSRQVSDRSVNTLYGGRGWGGLGTATAAAGSRVPAAAGRGAEGRSVVVLVGVGHEVAPSCVPPPFQTVPEHRGGVGLGDLQGEVLPRSEEHTSELQSRENLVCRL